MPEFTLVGLRVLREVATRGTFTSAAEALGYTQSAVSRQVAALEAAAGVPLFERTARGVRLTAAGHLLRRHADTVLDQLDAARRDLDGVRGSRGRLRVGAFPTAVAALVPRAIATYRAAHPGSEVVLREGLTPTHLRRLRARTVDVAVVATSPDVPAEEGLAFEPLLDDVLLLAVSRDHPLAGRGAVGLADLAGQRWIAGSHDPSDTFLGAWPDPPKVEFAVREWTAKLGLVAAGLGVTLVPGLAAPSVRPDVALVRVRDPQARRTVVIATRTDDTTHPFTDALRDAAARLRV
ncbi:LysR family transcriptional regulator [Saccharothrix variisporea]|uniref:DNA-binding transcriptional LysR family regulator n=1 Tax=Saccharothrix variisporea TaxID=543527 RepID=A0A495X5S1_9PSEU|nr:LysR family transcriptional regulator [Saccharothrix variisporea]RKT68444.1 DNA-binding transcriptional LysR family regulator [Saccharothrix variisporea]